MTGNIDDATIGLYTDEATDTVTENNDDPFIEYTISINGTILSLAYCNNQHDGYSCTLGSKSISTGYTYDSTSDYTVTIEWEASVISNGPFTQSAYNGDHRHLCTAANGAIEPFHTGRNDLIIVRGEKNINYY